MLKRTLFILALGVVPANPALAGQGRWAADANPATDAAGESYCAMVYADGQRLVTFSASPDSHIVGVFAPELEGMDTQLELALSFMGGTAYPLTWQGAFGSYTAKLSPIGLSTLLDAVILWDEEMRLQIGSETLVRVPLDGAKDAARTMFDCRRGLPAP